MTAGAGLPLVGLCLLLQGFFSGSEMALVSANRALLQARSDEGDAGAGLALHMLQHEEDRLLGTCLIGTNLCLIGGTTLFGLVMVQQGLPQQWLQTVLYVPFGLLLGEAVPKLVYRHYADTLAPFLARPIRLIQFTLLPALWFVARWSDLLKRVLTPEETQVRREDIVQLLDGEAGHIDEDDRALIRRLLAMNETDVEACMTPLVDVYAIDEDATVAEAVEIVLKEGYSRIPVYRERVDNIVGRVEHRDLLFAPADTEAIRGLVKPVRFVPDTKRVDELLREMRELSDPFAVVVDEYGGSVGIVTMEDLLEEVIGDIEDERDLRVPGIRKLGDLEWRVPARTEIEELAEAIGRTLPEGEYETVAGLLMTVTGHIPQMGETIRVGRVTFHVEAATERAVQLVRVVLAPE